MDLSAVISLFNNLMKSPWFQVLAVITAVLTPVVVYVRLSNALSVWLRNRSASKLEKQMAKSVGVAAYTEADIANACRNYVEPNCMSTDPSDESDLRNVVALAPLFKTVDEHLARGGERRHMILLADSGMGKTSFCINYYAREQKKKNKASRVAVVPLGSSDALVQIAAIGMENETILFLDAFDEDPRAAEDPYDRLRELMMASSKFKNVIVTCRSQFFETDDRIPKGSGIMYAASRKAGVSREFPLHKLFLAPFNEQQVEQYLAKNFSYRSLRNIRSRRQAHKLVGAIPELSVRPMLLELVPDLVRERRSIDQLFGLYQYLIDSWLKRERDWIEEKSLEEISIELAVRIFAQQRQGFGDRISADALEEIAVQHDSKIAAWKLKSRSLLNRDMHGNYKFAHRSVMEFLVLSSCLSGDRKPLQFEWTDLMKDLLVSLANTDSASERTTLEILELDHSKTGIFSLATSLAYPKVLSLAECRNAIRSEDVSFRHTRKIPVAWRNKRYDVKSLTNTKDVAGYIVNDQTHGLSWLVVDFALLLHQSDRELYAYGYTESMAIEPKLEHIFGKRLRTSLRHPSIEELITLWQCEPYVCELNNIKRIFCDDVIYWIGDRLEDSYLCCSFGKDQMTRAELKIVGTRIGSDGRKLHVYELLSKYGSVGRVPYKAFCAYLVDKFDHAVG